MNSPDDLEQLALATLLASFTGPQVPDWLAPRIDAGLAGVCLFGSNLVPADADGAWGTAGRVTAELHKRRPSLLVAIDEEGGDVTRLEAAVGSSLPGNAALGAVGDLELTRRVAGALGRALAAVGIDLDLAPVADVNVDPENPVIGVRSFGPDPARVAEQVAAFVVGLQQEQVAACIKHFPGHGSTRVDSHLGLPVVDIPAALLHERELAPFRAAIAAGAATVMTAHIRVPAFGDEPATINRRILTGVLRDELGFDGAVVTDALDMYSIGGPRHIPDNVVLSLAAGADLCCLGPDADDDLVGACVVAVVAAVREGRLDQERLVEAATRVGRIAPRRAEPVDVQVQVQTDVLADLQRLGTEAAGRALRGSPPTAGDLAGAHVIELDRPPSIAAGRVPWGVGTPLAALDPGVTSERLDADGHLVGALRRAAGRPLVVVARDPQRRPDQATLLAALAAGRPDLLLVDMGWPAEDAAWELSRITSYGASRASGDAVARWLYREGR